MSGPRNDRLDFGDNPDYYPDPGFGLWSLSSQSLTDSLSTSLLYSLMHWCIHSFIIVIHSDSLWQFLTPLNNWRPLHSILCQAIFRATAVAFSWFIGSHIFSSWSRIHREIPQVDESVCFMVIGVALMMLITTIMSAIIISNVSSYTIVIVTSIESTFHLRIFSVQTCSHVFARLLMTFVLLLTCFGRLLQQNPL